MEAHFAGSYRRVANTPKASCWYGVSDMVVSRGPERLLRNLAISTGPDPVTWARRGRIWVRRGRTWVRRGRTWVRRGRTWVRRGRTWVRPACRRSWLTHRRCPFRQATPQARPRPERPAVRHQPVPGVRGKLGKGRPVIPDAAGYSSESGVEASRLPSLVPV